MQPGRKGALAAESAQLFPGTNKRFLRQLLGEGRVSAHPQAKEIDPADVVTVKLFKCIHFPAGGPSDEILAASGCAGYTHDWPGWRRLRDGEGRHCFHIH